MTTKPTEDKYGSFDDLAVALAATPYWPQERIDALAAEIELRKKTFDKINWTGLVKLSSEHFTTPQPVYVCHNSAGDIRLEPARIFAPYGNSPPI
ncbi:hypothetical protein [Frigidibacter oleivorans]|uniref:hypothetical protein n=1 Tax=Frigidibacter oleivorans TaxID=2487129 RepID=UPI000F8E148C|nr:hypothetical protein [Frigidibacter oleivorans]